MDTRDSPSAWPRARRRRPKTTRRRTISRIADRARLVIGITGPNAAGKGEVASRLGELGFTLHSLSDVVREEAARRGLPPEREHLIRIGTLLREEGGAGVLAARMLPRLGMHDVVDSIRNPAEVAVLRQLSCFVLFGVQAGVETRFRRSVSRARPGDPATLEEFRERERQENSADPAGQQLEATFRLADRIIENDGDLETLRREVDRQVESCLQSA